MFSNIWRKTRFSTNLNFGDDDFGEFQLFHRNHRRRNSDLGKTVFSQNLETKIEIFALFPILPIKAASGCAGYVQISTPQ